MYRRLPDGRPEVPLRLVCDANEILIERYDRAATAAEDARKDAEKNKPRRPRGRRR